MGGLTQEVLTQRVYQILRDELLDVDGSFTARSNLVDAGLDSLAVTQLLLWVEETTGVWVYERRITPVNLESAESLATLVFEQLPDS